MSEDNNDIRTGRHCVFMMHVHLVFVTKYRRGVFTKEILDDLRPIFASVCNDFESELVEFDDSKEKISEHPQETLGRCAVVTKLLRWKLWWCSYCCDSQVHRATANAALNRKFKARKASPSALSSPPSSTSIWLYGGRARFYAQIG